MKVESWYNALVMVISTEQKQLLKRLSIKLGLGILGFAAAFAANNLGGFGLHPAVAAAIAALLDDVAEWANSRYELAARFARGYRIATGRN